MKNKKILIIVGSTNPVKVEAVKQAFRQFFKNIKVQGIKVKSGVADQPLSFEECFRGALNRCKEIKRKNLNADYYIGIEGGVQSYSFGNATAGLVVILDKSNSRGIGISSQLFLPKKIIKELKDDELGNVLDKLTNRKNVKHQEGAFGIFTNNIISRKDAYKQAIICALAKFINKELYQ